MQYDVKAAWLQGYIYTKSRLSRAQHPRRTGTAVPALRYYDVTMHGCKDIRKTGTAVSTMQYDVREAVEECKDIRKAASVEQSVGAGFQARSKDQGILEEGGGGGSTSHLPRRDHE